METMKEILQQAQEREVKEVQRITEQLNGINPALIEDMGEMTKLVFFERMAEAKEDERMMKAMGFLKAIEKAKGVNILSKKLEGEQQTELIKEKDRVTEHDAQETLKQIFKVEE